MNDFTILPHQVETCIQELIDHTFQDEGLRSIFPNRLLREDVLDLLDRYCTVVYYPLEEEECNNGFRVKGIPFSDGSMHDFVFINTAQTLEKQAFTAAHELGYIWNVDQYVIKRCDLSPEYAEPIVNRFAAVLLMPEREFRSAAQMQIDSYKDPENESITYLNLVKIIVHLMNHFFAPFKAVTLRLVEMEFFRQSDVETLLNEEIIPEAILERLVQACISEFGYVKLKNPTRKKWIEGLSEMLDIAEKEHLISENKINRMRERFELPGAAEVSPEMNHSVSLGQQEGPDTP